MNAESESNDRAAPVPGDALDAACAVLQPGRFRHSAEIEEALDRAAPHIVAPLVRGMISAFVIREEFHRATGDEGRKAGVRECIGHLQNYLACVERDMAVAP